MYSLVEATTGNIHAQCLDIMLPPRSMVLVIQEIFFWCRTGVVLSRVELDSTQVM
jgi:hypothetical protein